MKRRQLYWLPGMELSRPTNPQVERILNDTLTLIDEVGYTSAKIDMIRAKTELSVGTIYHHFGSKQGILAALYLQSIQLFTRHVRHALRSGDPETVVKTAVTAHMEWVAANPARARLLARRWDHEVHLNQAEIQRETAAVIDAIERWYRPLAERGELRELDLAQLYAVWFGPAQEYIRLHLNRTQEAPAATPAAETFAAVAWAALRPPG